MDSLRELIKSLIEAELKKLKYDEPSLHRPDDLSEDNNAQISALQKELNVLNQQLSNISSNSGIAADQKSKRMKSIQNKIKNKKDRIQKLKSTKQTEGEEELEEMSSVNAMGGGDSFMTPHAFSKPGTDPKKKRALSTNTWDIVESVNFRDPELSPKKKIAYAVREVRKQLAEVEKMIDNSAAFKENAGLKSSDFYKRTHSHLRKIGEHITRIMNKMQTIK